MARNKGEGTLIKRGKYWTARWVSNGEVHVRSTKCTSKRKALKKLEEFTKPFREKSDIAVLKKLFRVAMKHDKRIKVNVWDSFTKLKDSKGEKRRELTADEVKKLCEAADKHEGFNGELEHSKPDFGNKTLVDVVINDIDRYRLDKEINLF